MADAETKEEDPPAEEGSKILCFAKEMLPCKLMFLSMDAAMLSLFAFISLFYIDAGMPVSLLGIANSIGSVGSLIASPLWGIVIDKLKRNRMSFITLVVLLTTATEFIRPWVVIWVSNTKVFTRCKINGTAVNSSVAQLNTTNATCTDRKVILNLDTIFYAVSANALISSMLFAGMMCYVESAIIKTVFTRSKTYTYGEQKVFGPIGAGVGAMLAGVAVDHYHPKSPHLSPYLAAFYLYAPLSLLQLPLLYILTKQANWDYGKKKKNEKKGSVMKDIVSVLKKFEHGLFLIAVLVSGVSLALFMHYLVIFMDQTMHPSKTVLSVCTMVSMLSEMLIYPFTSKIVKFVGGQMRCVIIGISATALRLLVASYCTQPWQVFLIQPLHGLGMSLGWTAMIEHTWVIFPKEITTTAVGLLVSLHWIAPGIISNIAGGFLYEAYGGPSLFRGMALIGGVWVIVMVLYFEIYKRNTKVVGMNSTPERGISNDVFPLEEGGKTE